MLVPTPQQETCGEQCNTKQCSHQINAVSDAMGPSPAELGQNRELFENVRQSHNTEAANPQGLQF